MIIYLMAFFNWGVPPPSSIICIAFSISITMLLVIAETLCSNNRSGITVADGLIIAICLVVCFDISNSPSTVPLAIAVPDLLPDLHEHVIFFTKIIRSPNDDVVNE